MPCKNGEAQQCANTNRASIENTSERINDMNSIAKTELNFQGVHLQPIANLADTWLTASQIGYALQYADDKAVQRIYSRHADEFTEKMTGVVKVTTPYGEHMTRAFSLREAHLIAMFARTPVAKDFRRWVLDILDHEVDKQPESSPLYRYHARVIIRDNVFDAEVEFSGKAKDMNGLATGICKQVGFEPTGFRAVEVDASKLRKIH